MKKTVLYLIASLLFLSVKCECEDSPDDYLSPGIETRVYGNIYDSANNLPVENQTLIVAEYYQDFRVDGGAFDVFVQELDSVVSDPNGNFDFVFETGGMGTTYKLYPRHNNQILNYSDAINIPNIGGDNEFNFINFFLLYTCRLHITLNDLENLPFALSVDNITNTELPDIVETTGVVERVIYLNKFGDGRFFITRQQLDGTYQSAIIIIPTSNSLEDQDFDINLTNEDFE